MRLAPRPPQIKPQFSSSPDDPSPTQSDPVAASLRAAGPNRLRFRARPLWSDPSAPSGVREEVHTFGDPRKLLRLLHAIQTTPDRPLIGLTLEAIARPKWERVPLAWIAQRAEQRERRDQRKAGPGQ